MVLIRLNGAFRGQRITGQQRYASEVARRLIGKQPMKVHEKAPSGWWAAGPIRTWLWSQTVGFGRPSNEILLTLTSRGPLVSRRHVVVVHDLFVFTHPEWFSRLYAWTHVPVLWTQLLTAKAIIAVSAPVAEQVRTFTKGNKAVFVAPNAPAEVFLNASTKEDELDAAMLKFGLERGKFILTVGNLDPRKNLERLVESHKNLPVDLQTLYPLVIVGAPNLAFGHVSLVEDPGTRLLGYVSDEELAALYSSSNMVIFPTLDEGFGLPAVEALAVGARLVVSDIPVMRWVCEEFAIYVDPLSVASIEDGMRRQLESPPDSAAVRGSRRDYVGSRFSWQLTADEILDGLDGLDGLMGEGSASRSIIDSAST